MVTCTVMASWYRVLHLCVALKINSKQQTKTANRKQRQHVLTDNITLSLINTCIKDNNSTRVTGYVSQILHVHTFWVFHMFYLFHMFCTFCMYHTFCTLHIFCMYGTCGTCGDFSCVIGSLMILECMCPQCPLGSANGT